MRLFGWLPMVAWTVWLVGAVGRCRRSALESGTGTASSCHSSSAAAHQSHDRHSGPSRIDCVDREHTQTDLATSLAREMLRGELQLPRTRCLQASNTAQIITRHVGKACGFLALVHTASVGLGNAACDAAGFEDSLRAFGFSMVCGTQTLKRLGYQQLSQSLTRLQLFTLCQPLFIHQLQ